MWGVEESPSRPQAQETIGPRGINWAKHVYLKEGPKGDGVWKKGNWTIPST